MKPNLINKPIFIISTMIFLTPALSMAQPPAPGDGSDPFAAPVNGYVAVVTVIAFFYGAYKMYQISKKRAGNTNR